jgi:hypothetical protein
MANGDLPELQWRIIDWLFAGIVGLLGLLQTIFIVAFRRHMRRIDSHGSRLKKLEEGVIEIRGGTVTRDDLTNLADDIRRERLEAHAALIRHQDALHVQNQSTIGALSSQVELLLKVLLKKSTDSD